MDSRSTVVVNLLGALLLLLVSPLIIVVLIPFYLFDALFGTQLTGSPINRSATAQHANRLFDGERDEIAQQNYGSQYSHFIWEPHDVVYEPLLPPSVD